jgi:hypothetical protein
MCTIREKKYGVRDITLNDKGEKKKKFASLPEAVFFGKKSFKFL